jgi:hypothetical protein
MLLKGSYFCDYRETFLVPQDMILLPKVYTTLPVCMLHIVNNDTMEQVPKVFQKVVPYLYTKNKVGVKFVLPIGQNGATWEKVGQRYFQSS